MQRRRESILRATIINPKPLEDVRIVSLDYFLIEKKEKPQLEFQAKNEKNKREESKQVVQHYEP